MAKLILINGPRCCGKSSVSKELWRSLKKTVLLDLDAIKWLYSSYNEDYAYSLELAEKVALKMTEVYLSEKLNIILEKSFNLFEYIKPFIDLGNSSKVEIILINIEAPLEVLVKRSKTRTHKTSKETRTTSEQNIRQSFEKYINNKFPVDQTYDSSKLEISEIVKDIKKKYF